MENNAPKVLHVEVGGSYGGSLRALELYLANADPQAYSHEALLYYPTPGSEALVPLVAKLHLLYGAVPSRFQLRQRPKPLGRLRSASRRFFDLFGLEAVCCWLVELARSLPAGWRIFRLLRSGGYQLVHVNNTLSYQPATLLAARMARVPVVAHVRNPLTDSLLSKMLMRLVDRVVTVSRFHTKRLESQGLNVPIITCYDGVRVASPDQSRSSDLRALLLRGGQMLIGSVGRLDKQKGYENLVRAARRVVDAHPEVRFAVAGEGPLRPLLEKLIADLKLEPFFTLCGFQSDVADFLAALDIYVCSSLWEGLPLALVEAILFNKPVVATDVGGNSEVFVPGIAGRIVPASNPQALAEGLLSLLSPEGRARSQAEEAYRTVGAQFDPALNAIKFDRILRGALDGGEAGTREFYEHAYSTPAWIRTADESCAVPGSRFVKMWYQALLAHVLPGLQLEGARVLEVGAGYGYIASYFCQRGAEYIGADLASTALRQFPARPKCWPVLADGRCLPFVNASFDLLICMEVVEHLPNPNPLLDECFRVVRSGGKLIFSSPNYLNLFLIFKWLADAGIPLFRHYVNRQLIDRTTTSIQLRHSLARRGTILSQRAVRLHPPLFEQLDYRLRPDSRWSRINDFVFKIEKRWGERFPLNLVGLHTLVVVQHE